MSNILYMAPIQGATNYIYRNTYSKFFSGYDVAVTPFLASSPGKMVKRDRLKDIWPKNNEFKGKLIPQILSKNPADFTALALAMFDMGYDTVNWNLGCPLPKVSNKTRGSGLLLNPDLVISFLDEVLAHIPNKLSIKVRLGKNSPAELFLLLPRLNAFPLSEIIIHPRTALQMYKGDVDLNAFEQCLSLTRHTVVYSGDIHSLENYNELARRFPSVHGWMIGRGGIVNPFLPEEIIGIPSLGKKESINRFKEFHKNLVEVYQENYSGPAHVMDKMKELWFYWSQGFEGAQKFYQKVSRIKHVEQYMDEVNAFLDL
ncbi:MAG: tRNA-dihydrouridine synthase family protein [Candidatus Omnitrophica bacterium]|nr:tRNA-dihydrouridine synthase family protein [Candidatus Omnitrophota bacterium]